LWVNIVTDGPPALALGLDQDTGVMKKRPRNPESPLLDRESLRFIIGAGIIKALLAGALLVAMPIIGFTLLETRTALFLHTTIAQLFYAYPARRINAPPQFNGALHLAVILGIALQLLTVLLPSLRTLLGLEPPTIEMMTLVSTAVLLTWGSAELFSRLAASGGRGQENARV
jgi:Ca2+-transporting ATPase